MSTAETINIAPIAATASGRLTEAEQLSLWADLVETKITGGFTVLTSLIKERNARTDLDAKSATRFVALLRAIFAEAGVKYSFIDTHFTERSAQLQANGVFWHNLALDHFDDHKMRRILERNREQAIQAFAGSFVDPIANSIRDLEIVRDSTAEFFQSVRAAIASVAALDEGTKS